MRRPTSQPPVLPGYDFIRVLGSGGFSDVFLYQQQLPRRQVAVKVLLSEGLTPQTRRQFTDEANLMARLSSHPYIVTIFQAAVADDGRPYFVMEYCSGPSLATRYKSGPFTVEEALGVGVRLSSAVATAHAAGILHRDIKPANVLTNEYGAPELTDFGISGASDDDVLGHTTTVSRELAGGGGTNSTTVGLSVPWSPPEMFLENPKPDVRSDLYSLAATVFTILAGRTPFEKPGAANSQLDLAGRISRGAITPIDRDDVPASLRAVLAKAMDPTPSRRYSKASDFARALQGVEVELGYRSTLFEVANATVERPAISPDSVAEETRVAGIPVVLAQPSAPVARDNDLTTERSRRVPIDPVENTVIRATGPTTPDVATTPSPKRRRWPVVVAGSAVAVAIAAVLVVIGLGGHPGAESPSKPASTGDNESPVDEVVAPPEKGSISLLPDGTTVVFTWKNSHGKRGDEYVWAQAQGPNASVMTPTPDTTATVSGYSGAALCITVRVNRDGRLSAESLEECGP